MLLEPRCEVAAVQFVVWTQLPINNNGQSLQASALFESNFPRKTFVPEFSNSRSILQEKLTVTVFLHSYEICLNAT